jgi:hypothetical protein
MTSILVSDLTQATLDGTGVFDVLMRANKVHLDAEFNKNRIKGPEYATVYLGSLETVLQQSMSFLLQREKIALEAELMAQQVEIAKIQLLKTQVELDILQASQAKIPAEIALLEQQVTNLVSENLLTIEKVAQTTQQTTNLGIEADNLVKQGAVIDSGLNKIFAETAQITQQTANLLTQKSQLEAQTLLINQQRSNVAAEALNISKTGDKIDSDTALNAQQVLNLAAEKLLTEAKKLQTAQQTSNLLAEANNIPKQGQMLDSQRLQVVQQTANLVSDKTFTDSKTNLTNLQATNAVIEGTVLQAQKCKLDAEFDLLQGNTLKAASETGLLNQKIATEKAQTTALGVDVDSILGRQKQLFLAQADGFKRDAEQKAADLLIKTWNVRRTTDENTIVDATNMLNDATVGRTVNKLLNGIGA